LGVTQSGQAALQTPRRLAQLAPLAMTVQLGEAFGQRTAAAERDAEVMNGVSRQFVLGRCLFLQDAPQKSRQGLRR
jgi:hypothetical protein